MSDDVKVVFQQLAQWEAGELDLCPFADPAAALAGTLEHTLLKPTATAADIRQLCDEALTGGVHGVCVNPLWVSLCSEELQGSEVVVVAVVGFPLGASVSAIKAIEARRAVEQGAGELDMVLPLGLLRQGAWASVRDDILAVVHAAGNRPVKVILECCALTDEEKVQAVWVAQGAGAAWVKTSTGFGAGGATTRDVALLRLAAGDAPGVKAAGGIRDYQTALAMLRSGASRIGASCAPVLLACQ